MSMYSCEPCMKTFNGIKPYESHLASEKHRMKVCEPISIVKDFKNCCVNSSNTELEPFIILSEQHYKCTLCKTFLNSIDQVKSHINGGKHLKAKAFFSNVSASHNQIIDGVKNVSLPSTYTEDSQFQIYKHIDDNKKLVENIRVFKPNDEIIFNINI